MDDHRPGRPQLEYVRVADAIAEKITKGELAPGARLPPEREIAVEYGVAYQTARRAMDVLRDRGLIVTIWGKGTFVADPQG